MCKMEGQLADSTEHSFPECTECVQHHPISLPSPLLLLPTCTQTIHSHSLPCQMGIRKLRLEKCLRLKVILMLLQIKLHSLHAGLQG